MRFVHIWTGITHVTEEEHDAESTGPHADVV
jgi:hypothetical protein